MAACMEAGAAAEVSRAPLPSMLLVEASRGEVAWLASIVESTCVGLGVRAGVRVGLSVGLSVGVSVGVRRKVRMRRRVRIRIGGEVVGGLR